MGYSSSLSASTDLLPFSLPLIPSIPLLANLICCPLPRPLTPPRLPATTSLSLSISLSLTLSTAASYKTPPPHQQTYAKTPQTTHTRIPTRTQTLLHLVGLRSSRRTNIILVLPQQYHAQHDDERTTEIAYPRPSCILTPIPRRWRQGVDV